MTKEFRYLMHLFSCGARGVNPQPSENMVDWARLISLANSQAVSATVAYALLQAGPGLCPDDYANPLIATMKASAINNYVKTYHILKLLGDFENEGLPAVVLKGFAVAESYAAPECRISSDTDVYVDPTYELRAYEFLQKHGFRIEPRSPKTHHAVCFHQQMGCLELHMMLYDEIVEDVWFDGFDDAMVIHESYERVNTEDGAYYTLGKTDHMIFLALHTIKHFIISDMNLRMMMDTALFFAQHAKQIDSTRLWQILARLKYRELAETMLGAMIEHGGFLKSDFPGLESYDLNKIRMLLDDLEAGSLLESHVKAARKDSWAEYNKQRLIAQKNTLYYKFYMLSWNASNYLHVLFLKRSDLAKLYPYIDRCVLLIPYAWCHRLITRGMHHLFGARHNLRIENKEEELSDWAGNRMNMFRKFGMI